jgi:hypothetical protein
LFSRFLACFLKASVGFISLPARFVFIAPAGVAGVGSELCAAAAVLRAWGWLMSWWVVGV